MCKQITNKDLELNTKFALCARLQAKTKFHSRNDMRLWEEYLAARPQNPNQSKCKRKTNKTNPIQSNDYDLKIGEYLLFTHQITIFQYINRQVNGQYEREPPHWTRPIYPNDNVLIIEKQLSRLKSGSNASFASPFFLSVVIGTHSTARHALFLALDFILLALLE